MNALQGSGPPEEILHSRPEAGQGSWRLPLLVFAAGVILWGVLFREEITHAVSIWESSVTYNHGWLILPLAIWLAWTRRHRLALLRPSPSLLLALAAILPALAWLAADRMGIMEGRQFGALGLFYALVLGIFGWRIALAMAAPLAYLVFLVPFGDFTVPALQSITARMVDVMLDWTDIPHYVDDLLIEIPAGRFYVAEACAGLRFIIAALAFGALYAFVMFRSPWRRLAVMVLALVVPIIANGIRAFGLVVLGHWWGNAAAVDADHLIYGWGFFSFVLLLLILAGLPFRQDQQRPPVLTGPGRPRRPAWAVAAGALALALAASGPAVAARLDATVAASPPQERPIPLSPPSFCEPLPDGRLNCQGVMVSARLVLFAPQVNWSEVARTRRRLTLAVSDQDVTFDVPIAEGGAFRARQPTGQPGTTAAAAWLDGRMSGDGLRSRATQAWRVLRGEQSGGPVIVVLELMPNEGPSDGQRERNLLRLVLEAQEGALVREAANLSVQRAPGG